jgi:hypothetical protein
LRRFQAVEAVQILHGTKTTAWTANSHFKCGSQASGIKAGEQWKGLDMTTKLGILDA